MDETKNPYGTSILVPSVQELAKEVSSVPPRYIHHQHEDLVISEIDPVLEIPVIDMQRLLSMQSGNSELSKLHLACKDWGFFQVYFLLYTLHFLNYITHGYVGFCSLEIFAM